ncbi:hypothetical protein [Natrinema versiforme]|uniref:Uncharacterized protein n=1 Tax=Natrinema versiforme TaxID=88724 RepID=A0A4P8WNS3_9EURY|nr:hypothetical protein [Natrinema versiforme]QCS43711.1 hypothetical protein FEJ81_15630 [Natrinema versiforme]
MSSTQPSLRDRFRDDLRSGSLPVLLTAVPIAMAVGTGSAWYWDEFAGGFLLLVTIGVLVPSAHDEYGPRGQSWSRDVLWTIAASAVATGLFTCGYLIAGTLLTQSIYRATIAFLLTYLGGGSTLFWLR